MREFIAGIFGPSTRQFLEEGKRASSVSIMDMIHGYAYLRWPYLYIDIARGDHALSKILAPIGKWVEGRAERRVAKSDPSSRNAGRKLSFADTYHGKVVTLEAATRLIQVDREVTVECPEKVIPYPVARDIVMKNPGHIVVMDCPCRDSRERPCMPMDVCLIVGDPFASFVEEHHPHRSRRVTREEAETILKQEDERGHVHHAFFKDAMLGRFYAICNCCSCCCGAMHAHQHGSTMLASSGYIASIDDQVCLTCGDCNGFCQFNAIVTDDITTSVDRESCMGCGICVGKCLSGAISLIRDVSKGDPLEIEALTGTSEPAYAGENRL